MTQLYVMTILNTTNCEQLFKKLCAEFEGTVNKNSFHSFEKVEIALTQKNYDVFLIVIYKEKQFVSARLHDMGHSQTLRFPLSFHLNHFTGCVQFTP